MATWTCESRQGASLGFQVHRAVVLLPVVFGIHYLVRRQWRCLLAFIVTGTVVAIPWATWNIYHFGEPFHSHTSTYLPQLLGLWSQKVHAGRIAEVQTPYTVETFFHYPVLVQNSLAPLLPGVFVLAGRGFVWGVRRGGAWAVMSWVSLLGSFVWMLPAYLEDSPTRYYPDDSYHTERYEEMRSLALEAANLEKGVMLGFSTSLDGGIETVYWSRLPFVAGRLAGVDISEPGPELGILIRDFDVRYIWVDESTRERVLSDVPGARLRAQRGSYAIIEFGEPSCSTEKHLKY